MMLVYSYVNYQDFAATASMALVIYQARRLYLMLSLMITSTAVAIDMSSNKSYIVMYLALM